MNEFLIKSGKHYPAGILQRINPNRLIVNPTSIKFDFRFTHSTQYAPIGLWWERRKENYYYPLLEQINKIAGISFDLQNKNSARIGFRFDWEVNRFFIYAYFHIDGEIHYSEDSKFIVSMNDIITGEIVKNNQNIIVQVYNKKGETKVLDIIENTFDKSLFGYVQHPYFGGKIPAPHGLRINVDNIIVNGR